jgi:preprotein translocase subunit SecA
MLSLIKKTFGDTNERRLKKYIALTQKINALEPGIQKLNDDELKEKTFFFKEQLSSGRTIDDIKVEAFAVVREAARRVLGMRHFDVQLIGGLVLMDGHIAEMATGEGKTLVASLPSYLRALEGKGVHVITVNDYLAKRDKEIIGQVHEFLGLTVGLNVPMLTPIEKQKAYTADITYGIGNEFGFDYLRDNMVSDIAHKVQRPYHFAIIDEVDSVLIDEAKTPLIVAGKMQGSSDLYYIAARLAKRFRENEDYTYDDETKATSLTDEGISKVEKAFGVENLYEIQHQTLYHYVIQALRALVIFKRDVDYIISDGKIMLVDMFTGRVMEGRTLSDGLHQAIEAKEGLQITEENKTQASITVQNYFRMYPNFAGMTGTAKTEESEFQHVYGMDIIQIPTNKPKIRLDMPDYVLKSKHDKYLAVVEEVKRRHQVGQPVLIGTTSILQSEKVAEYLDKERLPYELLNAKAVEHEVRLISQAGQRGRITIATNMAGRGTDILLGQDVAQLGGLHVLGTERHESRRIDNQLKGRSGRQGDPGSSQFFISIEDDMFRRFAKEEIDKMIPSLKTNRLGLIGNKKIHEFVDRVQRIVEGSNFSMREYNLKLDDVINQQRNVVYSLRSMALQEKDVLSIVLPMIHSSISHTIDTFAKEDELPEEWDIASLKTELLAVIPPADFQFGTNIIDRTDLKSAIDHSSRQYVETAKTYQNNEKLQTQLRQLLLVTIDVNWIKHLENMTRLKEGIGMRHYQQEDPMRLYQQEGLELFTIMYGTLEKEISTHLAILIKQFQQN